MTPSMYEAYGPRHLIASNNVFTGAVFLGIKKTFDKTWHLSLLYK
jgi:hypothetical protein